LPKKVYTKTVLSGRTRQNSRALPSVVSRGMPIKVRATPKRMEKGKFIKKGKWVSYRLFLGASELQDGFCGPFS
jgi:hypothetical protein